MEKLKLVFVNHIGEDWQGRNRYEFLFAYEHEDVCGEDWENFPASGIPQPPGFEYIDAVGNLTTNLKFDTVQQSSSFCMYDAVDGLIALAWEDIIGYEEYPEKRIHFGFGLDIDTVKLNLEYKGLDIDIEYIKNGKKDKN